VFPDTISRDELTRLFGHLEPVDKNDPTERSMAIRRLSSGKGYTVYSQPEKQRLCMGSEPNDAIFSKPGLGRLNITRARRWLKQSRTLKAEKMEISETVMKGVLEGRSDPLEVSGMTIQERNAPVLFLQTPDGFHLIDGHNRLRRRVDDGLTFVKYYALKSASIDFLRVETYRLENDVWVKYDAMTDVFPEIAA
jgi:hypothetical protein